ncbi:hypothetical protein DL96DRAFT_19444 [Flagelloscypha sp. PMI_526]|nr:hypothetical protein DL96DRAFT_19444 [Flagelloscypha sp. PMI_526]
MNSSGKTRWVYDPASYILGYYAIGAEVTLVSIKKNTDRSQQQSIAVTDIVRFSLLTRKSRVENAVRMIRLVKLLRTLERVVTQDVDRDMLSLYLEGGKLIEFFRAKIRKRYQRQDSKIVLFLVSLYGLLGQKSVPSVDRLVDSEISSSNTLLYLSREVSILGQDQPTMLRML